MSTKHTPGPWHVRAKAGRVYIQAANHTQVASIVRQASDAEQAFNADLLAAAPDLLAALREALACIEKHVPKTTFAPRDMIRAAIAKAVQS